VFADTSISSVERGTFNPPVEMLSYSRCLRQAWMMEGKRYSPHDPAESIH
jgi:hypothetical protein